MNLSSLVKTLNDLRISEQKGGKRTKRSKRMRSRKIKTRKSKVVVRKSKKGGRRSKKSKRTRRMKGGSQIKFSQMTGQPNPGISSFKGGLTGAKPVNYVKPYNLDGVKQVVKDSTF